jgi:outer membrane protein assembly factor BamA
VDTAARPPEIRVHVRRGPRVRVGAVRITGAEAVDSAAVRRLIDTTPGAPFDPRAFEADVQALLDRYEAAGRPLAQIRTETTLDTTTSRLALTLAIDEGPKLWLKAIEVPDEARTSPGLIARLTDLRVGAPLIDYDPAALRQSLRESPYFRSVGPPALRVTEDGGAILRVPVEEASPGAFDVVLGYLPPSGRGDGGQLVGSGELTLEHLFGGGRRLDLALNRRPGQTSIVDVTVSDPYVLGLPVRLTASFRGEQRDSTYGERRYGLGAGYQLTRAFEVSGRVSREVVTPGQAGGRLRDGRQRIPRAQTLFYGVGLRYEAVDRRVNPRRGVRLRVRADQGRKERTRRRVTAAGDTTRERSSLRQERLRGTVRAFVPFFDRQVLVLGGDGAVLRSPSYDRSDLFRFGGAESLRGYDEDRFLGNVTVRGLVEYRLQLDRRSYAYVFGDLGYVERPALGAGRALRDWRPGYGLGLQIQTAIGRIRTTYALNPEVSTPADGRIHFGLSVGL